MRPGSRKKRAPWNLDADVVQAVERAAAAAGATSASTFVNQLLRHLVDRGDLGRAGEAALRATAPGLPAEERP